MNRKIANRKERHHLLRRVLTSGRGRLQTWAAVTAFVIGLILMLFSLNLAIGIYRVTRPDHGQHADYLIVNKRVTIGGALTAARPTFSEREIERLRAQAFVVDVGEFTTSRFRVSLIADPAASSSKHTPDTANRPNTIGMEMPLYTDLFFESVPTRFLDIVPPEWDWTPESAYLPIIVSREFLNLYNFSFAIGQGLPQIPESLVGAIAGWVTITGPLGQRTLPARVAGLSDRFPSILVPAQFMRWGHDQVTRARPERPSRLVVKTGRPADSAILDFFSRHHYQVNSERLRAGQFGRMALVALGVVGGMGSLFVFLAALLFVMLYRLLLAETAPRIALLLQLGYSPSMLIRHVQGRFRISVAIITLVTAGMLAVIFPVAYRRMAELGFDTGQIVSPGTLIVGIGVLGLTAFINRINIRRAILRNSVETSSSTKGRVS